MNIWEHINRIEELTFPLDGAASVVKLVAEQLQDNDNSSALWLASDVIKQQADAISNQVAVAMVINKAMNERITKLEKELAKAKTTHKRSLK